jgi:hypothetical protein
LSEDSIDLNEAGVTRPVSVCWEVRCRQQLFGVAEWFCVASEYLFCSCMIHWGGNDQLTPSNLCKRFKKQRILTLPIIDEFCECQGWTKVQDDLVKIDVFSITITATRFLRLRHCWQIPISVKCLPQMFSCL